MEAVQNRPAEAAQRYHLGLRPTALVRGREVACPFFSLHLGPVTFHQVTERVEGEGNETKRVPVQGGYATLTRAQLQEVKRDLDRYRVRWLDAELTKSRLCSTAAKDYHANPERDMRLDPWLYCNVHTGPSPFELAAPASVEQAPPWEPDNAEEVAAAAVAPPAARKPR